MISSWPGAGGGAGVGGPAGGPAGGRGAGRRLGDGDRPGGQQRQPAEQRRHLGVAARGDRCRGQGVVGAGGGGDLLGGQVGGQVGEGQAGAGGQGGGQGSGYGGGVVGAGQEVHDPKQDNRHPRGEGQGSRGRRHDVAP